MDAPTGWLARAEPTMRDPFGAWVEIHGRGGAFQETLLAEGELIAVSADTILVATTDWATLRRWATDVQGGRRAPWITPEMTAWSDTVGCELVAVSRDAIRWLELSRYAGTDSDALESSLAGIGLFTSFAHGWFALISVPIWIGAAANGPPDGQATTALRYDPSRPSRHSSVFGESSGSSRRPRDEKWESLRAWARFPQGLPGAVDRSTLRPKLGPLVPTSS